MRGLLPRLTVIIYLHVLFNNTQGRCILPFFKTLIECFTGVFLWSGETKWTLADMLRTVIWYLVYVCVCDCVRVFVCDWRWCCVVWYPTLTSSPPAHPHWPHGERLSASAHRFDSVRLVGVDCCEPEDVSGSRWCSCASPPCIWFQSEQIVDSLLTKWSLQKQYDNEWSIGYWPD